MKKNISPISIILSSAMLLSMPVPVTVFAAEDEIMQKDVTAYLYSMKSTETLSCVFKNTMPDMPYISTTDFLSNIFEGTANEVKKDDGKYIVSVDSASMIIDTENDTVHFDEFEVFMSSEPIDDGTALDSTYCNNLGTSVEGETNSLTLNLGKYDIDIIEYDGKSYFPASTLSLLFSQTYNAAEYVSENIYFVHCSDIISGEIYVDRTSIFEDDHRSQEMIDLTYSELCFAVDILYGRPSKSEIAASIEEKGFDCILDEYSDYTRTTKEKLLSDSKVEFLVGLSFLDKVFYDGGHIFFSFPMMQANDKYSDTAVISMINNKTNDYNNPDALASLEVMLLPMASASKKDKLVKSRSEAFDKYEVVKTWDDVSASQLIVSGDTAVFSFGSFMNEAFDHFKWSLDYAKDRVFGFV